MPRTGMYCGQESSLITGVALVGLCLISLVVAPVASATDCQCGDTLRTDTDLTNDLVGCPGDGLVIDADNIALNGDGHTISGTGVGSGIKIMGRDGVVVTGCDISGFQDGVNMKPGSERDSILSNTISSNTRHGVNSAGNYEVTNRYCLISGNTIANNSDCGVYFFHTNNSSITGNTITGNAQKGVWIYGEQQTGRDADNHVVNNDITGSNYGVNIGWAYGYQDVIGNTITDNNYGIATWSTGFWTTFSGNTIYRNAVYGISAVGCFLLVIEDNDVQYNGQGVYLRGSMGEGSDSRLASNIIRNNTRSGIYLDHRSGDWELVDLAVTGNDISDNQEYGVYVGHLAVTEDSIYDNDFARNTLGNAYEVAGVTGNRWNSDVIGNRWDDWASNPGYPDGLYYIDGPGDGVDSLPGGTVGVPRPGLPRTVPSAYAIYPSSPNPFGGGTAISYDLPEPAGVKIRVYDVAGRVVRVLVDSPFQEAGRHEVCWDSRDTSGDRVAPGTYFCRMDTAGFTAASKMILAQ